jgi:hypothetical protein
MMANRDENEMTDAQREEIARRLLELDGDPAGAADAKALRGEIAARLRAFFEKREEIIRLEHTTAKALGFKSTQRYLASLMADGRPRDKWVRFDGAKLKKLREGLPSSICSQKAFGKKCEVSDDTVGKWERLGRARAVDFENVLAILQAHNPAIDVRSTLLGQ